MAEPDTGGLQVVTGLARRSFYITGEYQSAGDATVMAGQAYVSAIEGDPGRLRPAIVFVHGGSLTGTNFETTPDGRAGWAELFADGGFNVYLLEQPGRGRSGFVAGQPVSTKSVERVEQFLTAPERYGLWRQAGLHSRWPGTGLHGDPVFDQFYASHVPQAFSAAEREQHARRVGRALLERVGPAVLVTHSQSGPLGWQILDAAPELVRAVVAVEPAGPPFADQVQVGPPDYVRDGEPARRYGVTESPLGFQRTAYGVDERHPAAAVPVLIVTSEASYHIGYDHLTAELLAKAGLHVNHLKLAEKGIHGNGHMMMLEDNSDEIGALLLSWIMHTVLP